MKIKSIIFILCLPIILVSQPCLPEGIEITSQSQIDSFAINYPNCTEIEGYVAIIGENITSLNGLNVIESVNGSFAIWGCSGLLDLTGIESLSHVGGWLQIGHNVSLTNLTSLSGLSTIGGALQIIGNDSLTSLFGLENIEEDSIDHLSIFWNQSLTTCDIENICSYLTSSTSIISIYDNAIGCNSQEEIEEACSISLAEFNNSQKLIYFHNPAKDFIRFNYSK